MNKLVRIGVLVSGSGSNLQAIMDATRTKLLQDCEVALVISNKKDAFALERAKKENVPALFLNPQNYISRTAYFEKIIEELTKYKVDLVCLAGFLLKIESNLIQLFPRKILNIHPSLLPKFGGKGMYGTKVHEAVLKAGEKESGCTVHIVDDEYDHGPIVSQKKVPVMPQDSVATLAARVLTEEHKLYPEAIRLFIQQKFWKNCSESVSCD